MSRKGHVPIRLCVGCKQRKRKEEMIRFTLRDDKKARVENGDNPTGRGLYVCPDTFCLKKAKKRYCLELFPEIGGFEEDFGKKSGEGKTD